MPAEAYGRAAKWLSGIAAAATRQPGERTRGGAVVVGRPALQPQVNDLRVFVAAYPAAATTRFATDAQVVDLRLKRSRSDDGGLLFTPSRSAA